MTDTADTGRRAAKRPARAPGRDDSRNSRSLMAKKKQDPSAAGGSDAELDLALLRSMLMQRRFEERCAEAYALGKIGGFCHLYIG